MRISDFMQVLKYARTLYQRSLLAVASTLYAMFTLFGPSLESYTFCAGGHLPQTIVLPENYKLVAAFLFAVDAAGLWWRIFDPKPRVKWATTFNIMTAFLWLTVTLSSIYLYHEPWQGNVGEMMLTLTALYTLTRTDYSPADRGAA